MKSRDLVEWSMRTAGVADEFQSVSSRGANDALLMLNAMIGQWSKKRYLVYHLKDHAITSTGALYYTIGPGQDFDTDNPDRIESAYVRLIGTSDAQAIDYPLRIIPTYEDYNTITLKSLRTWPSSVFYDSDYPIGRLYIWPKADTTFEIHITTKDQLQQFPNLDQDIVLPGEYMEALMWNLAGRLALMWRLPPDPMVAALAQETLSTIRSANLQVPWRKPQADLPGMMGVNSSDSYDELVVGGLRGVFKLDEDRLG